MNSLSICIAVGIILILGVLLVRRGDRHSSGGNSLRVTITGLDSGPDELAAQLPRSARIIRAIPGSDRPDYLLAELERPMTWTHDGQTTQITHLIVGAYLAGQSLTPGTRGIGLQIAYVIDQSLLRDARLDFSKCHPCAIGFADVT